MSKLHEHIQDGQNLSNEMIRQIRKGLENLNKKKSAMDAFKETFEADFAKLMNEYQNQPLPKSK
jgi:hypothetical protein